MCICLSGSLIKKTRLQAVTQRFESVSCVVSFDFTVTVQNNFPSANIECIFFDNDAKQIKKYGKGYGESKLLNASLVCL